MKVKYGIGADALGRAASNVQRVNPASQQSVLLLAVSVPMEPEENAGNSR